MERIPILGFILAILYFITTKLACNGYTHMSNNIQSEQEALIDFKSGLKDPNNRLSSWKGSNYCYWQGITCEKDTGIVISIDLHNPYPQFTISKLIGLEFSGTIPSNFRNLSNLHLSYEDLSYDDFEYFNDLSVGNIEWMASLVSLKYLGMDYVNLSSGGSEWVEVLNKLPILTELHLDGCSLSAQFHLQAFIKSNQFISMFPEWLLNVSSLGSIDISYNQLHGRIPLGLGELPNLQHLDLFDNYLGRYLSIVEEELEKIEFLNLGDNELHGPIPSSFGNFCNLKYLDLSLNYLNGSLPEIIKGIETCSSKSPLPNLTELYLYDNQLMGKLPNWLGPIPSSFGNFCNLKYLYLGLNYLNGSLPDSIGQLSELQVLDVGSNQLSGSLSEQHFWKLSKLEYLNMDSNSFCLNVSPNWVPPFQVKDLDMGSCHLGPSFPVWLQSQKNLQYLDFSNASISSHIPNWFWNISFNLEYLSLSHNQLQGQLPNSLNFSSPFLIHIDFSSNIFEGPIPFLIKGVTFLDLSHNKFSGPIPLSRGESLSDLRYLLLSHNQITGPIPSNIGEFLPSLYFLSLSSNRITGTIPDSIGHITSLEVIDFSRNNLTGGIPSTINNCSRLIVLDLGNNNLSGMIPKSLGRLQWLQSLHLNDNKLLGELPSSFQNLSSLELLDLSYNELSGKVPSWIGTAFINLVILNLRSNAFFGRLPDRLSNLSSYIHGSERNMDMYSLYHSGNGSRYDERLIVNTKDQSLEYTRTISLVVSIDLSDNNLTFGTIPSSMSSLTFLGYLNLSNNNFSVRSLCGQMTTFTDIGLGFAVGILVPYFVLAIRRSWCDAYFDFVDKIVKWLLFKRRMTYAKNHAQDNKFCL
ncbi:hypothetical protein AAG906_005995 [Vitis piasezkii]